jgi:hypothetical protein
MERAFEESEVFEVVKALNGDKAMGPNSFSLPFFQPCWEILKEDIMNVFHDIHARGKFERSLNATLIPLIPRKAGAVDIKDFCPISLARSVYKIISKSLANRLEAVLEKVISMS